MFRMIFMIFFYWALVLVVVIYIYIYIDTHIYFPHTVTLIQIIKLNKNGDKTLFGEITVE